MAEPNAFTGARLDRAADGRRRDAAFLAAQLEHPAARALVAGTAGVRASGGRLELIALAEARDGAGDGHEPLLLGLDADGPLFAVDEDPPVDGAEPRRAPMIGSGGRRGEPAPEAPGRMSLREAVGVLSQDEGGLLAYAAGLLNWHRTHRFCSVCAAPTVPAEGGHTRSCPRCGTDHHPRVDPVVIMLVTDGDRVLLGRQPIWPARRYSALAGFVGPGESLEEAVAREVAEEAGVQTGRPVYVSSQPWPFPSSLMLGFMVPWTGGEVGGTDPELEDVRWFARAAVAEAARTEEPWDGEPGAGDGVLLPPRTAIARTLIETWLRGGPGV
jgi:NAD+ diphosphatase